MPVAPRRPCSGRGPRRGQCPNLIQRGQYVCGECEPYVKQAIRKYDKERDKDPQRVFLHSTTWRKVREMKLRRDPLCERHIAQGQTVAACLVHHADRDETNTADENLESLCVECHEAEHKGERFGRA
jgi:5-methylcytosine-specific restriction protein A